MNDDERGVTPVVAIVLLVGLVSIGSVGILLVAGSISDGAEDKVENERIKKGFEEIGKDVTAVSRSSENSRVVNLELPDDGDSAVREEKAGRIWINSTDLSGGGGTTELVNRSIGAIRYEGEDGTVFAYQSGAVFQGTGEGTTIVSYPGFEYALNESGGEPTLSVPIITTVGPDALPNGKVVVRKNTTETPINNKTVLRGKLVTVTVKSEWYRGWADYFRTLAAKTGAAEAAVSVNPTRQTATLRLLSPVSQESLKGIVQGSPQGQINLNNNIDISSYNSSKGPFGDPASTESDGDLYVAGNLTFDNKAHVNGSVFVGKTLLFKNGANTDTCKNKSDKHIVCENATYGTLVNKSGKDAVGGSLDGSGAPVPNYNAVDNTIEIIVGNAENQNDNGNTGNITADRLQCGGSGNCTLDGPGTYYLDEIATGDLEGTLILNTSGGPIDIAVDGPVSISKTDVEVVGGSRVNVYIASNRSGPCTTTGKVSGCDFRYGSDSFIEIKENGSITDDASKFWVFMRSDSSATFRKAAGGKPIFTGVLFGPGRGPNPGADVVVGQGNIIQGTVVGNIKSVAQKTEIRYDRSLRTSTIIVDDFAVPRVTYLVASEFVVEVDDE